MIYGVLYLLVTMYFTTWCVVVDAEHINKKQYIENHRSRWFMRSAFFLAIGISHPFYGIASVLFFSALFDQLLNKARALSFWYLGATAKWDIFFLKHKRLYITTKLLSIIFAILIFLSPIIGDNILELFKHKTIQYLINLNSIIKEIVEKLTIYY